MIFHNGNLFFQQGQAYTLISNGMVYSLQFAASSLVVTQTGSFTNNENFTFDGNNGFLENKFSYSNNNKICRWSYIFHR